MSSWQDPYARFGMDPYPQTYVYLPPQHRSSTAHLVFAWLAAVLSAGYMLPWAIGATRNRTNCAATAVVNFFLGWTLVGWVIALVMACGSEPQQPVVVQTVPRPNASGAPVRFLRPGTSWSQPAPSGTHPYGPGTQAALSPPPPAIYPLYPAPTGQPSAAEVTMPLPPYGPTPYGPTPDGDRRHDPRRNDLR